MCIIFFNFVQSFILPFVQFRHDMGSPEGKSIISNPVAIHDSNNQTFVFCLCDDGQVYFLKKEADGTALEFGKWLSISAKIPFEAGI